MRVTSDYVKERRLQAQLLTVEAQKKLEQAKNILATSLETYYSCFSIWEEYKQYSSFPEKPPKPLPSVTMPPRPLEQIVQSGTSVLAWFEKDRVKEAAAVHENAVRLWEQECERLREQLAAYQRQYDQALAQWQNRKQAFYECQTAANEPIHHLIRCYTAKHPAAIVEFCKLVLAGSKYPEWLKKEYSIDYDQRSRIIVVDFLLPNPNDLPSVKEVRYSPLMDAFETKHVKKSEADALYGSVVHQICLRTFHELLETDAVDAISIITFNGHISYIDRSTGHSIQACIVSLQAKKGEFQELNLRAVDPAQCFRRLKGLGSPALQGLVPVAPILQLRTEDARFVASEDVAAKLDEGTNLAAVGWEDFEHLIRELFEKEFESEGAEVRVTRASRDAGVDAVVFDPNPIRGGKIVIQAKRYTNTVDVSAVRDLYGTVMNEGAIKGILVTTSGFGPDAHAFAKGKPLTLLDGANLVHLLQKHGRNVRIDLKEAKELGTGLLRRSG